jgi:hypothetical protein
MFMAELKGVENERKLNFFWTNDYMYVEDFRKVKKPEMEFLNGFYCRCFWA